MSSVQVTITQLPAAGAITGQELVPIVQNGQTVQTTTAAISASPSQTQTFLTLNQEPTLANSRRLAGGTGIGLVDGGAQSTLQITLNGTSGSLETAGDGFAVKVGSGITPRTLQTSGDGLSVSNGDGQSGNPVFSLTGVAAALAGLSGSGLVAVLNGATVTPRSIAGTADQIDVTNGNALSGNPTIGLASNPTLPGTGGALMPYGDTASRPVAPPNGTIRYNTDLGLFEGYANNAWGSIATGGGVTSVATGNGLTGGPITSTGTIEIDDTVVATLTDSQTLTNKTISGSSNTLSNIGNSSLTNSAITINGTSTSLGGSINVGTVTSVGGTGTVNGLTLTGTVTSSGNLTLGGTLSNIANSALTNSSVTIGTTAISLGATSLTLGGLTSVTVTQDPASAFELATKQYVDGLASTGLYYHAPVQAATTASLASITGGTVTYNNGTAGVGATLTLSVALTAVDGYSLSNTNRILVQNESNQAHNGVYTWATGGTVLTRSTDTDTYGTGTGDLSENDYFFCQNGTVNKGNSFVCTTSGTIVFGTTAITFSQFSTSQVYTGTSPIQVSGTVISLNTVPTTSGGTGLTSFTSGGAVYATSTSALTTGTLPVASGGTGLASYTSGDLLYASGSTTLSKLAIGTTNYVLTSSGTAPQYVAQSTLSVGSATNATNATNTGITADSTNATNYLTFVSTTTGNLPQLVNSSITCNPSTGSLTGGIMGGAF
jgi:hypothetical protein